MARAGTDQVGERVERQLRGHLANQHQNQARGVSGPRASWGLGETQRRELAFHGWEGENGRSRIPELGGRGCHTVFLALPEAQIFHCLTTLGFTEVHTFPASSGAQGQPLSYPNPYCLLSQPVSIPSRCPIFLTVSPSGTSAGLWLNSGKTSYMRSRPQGRKELIHPPSSGNKRIHPLSPGSKIINPSAIPISTYMEICMRPSQEAGQAAP